ncbi:MAG: head GIN domain-containing protein [Chloroherpetonaceae bacterium]|nr:head GIN domain-containing protein [Chloroherpetonaceae bacterium]
MSIHTHRFHFHIRFISLSLLLLLFSACEVDTFIVPSGSYAKQVRAVGTFESIEVANGFDLRITDSETTLFAIETYANVQENIIVEVVGSKLRVYQKPNVSYLGDPDVKVYISKSTLTDIVSSGGGNVLFENQWSNPSLLITVSGGGEISGEVLMGSRLELTLSGGSKATLSGSTPMLKLNSSGGGTSRFLNLTSTEADAIVSGGGFLELQVLNKFWVEASGGSTVRYKGSPAIERSVLTGGSTLEKVP